MSEMVDLEQGRGLLGRTSDPDQNRYTGFLGYMLSKFEVNPTLEEQEIAREIAGLVGVKFDDKNARHVEDLRSLWIFIFPEEKEKGGPDPDDPRWKEIGFQSKTPATDFRGGGILSLYCMMYSFEIFVNYLAERGLFTCSATLVCVILNRLSVLSEVRDERNSCKYPLCRLGWFWDIFSAN